MTLPWPSRTVLTVPRDDRDFAVLDACTAWVRERGGSAGPLQRGAPLAFRLDDCGISKWRNLGRDRDNMHGAIVSDDRGSFRYGPLRIELRTEVEL